MAFQLPSRTQAGTLASDSELNKEWATENSVRMADGTEVNWAPPPPKPVMPDWSEIKQIRHYFNRTYKNNFWPTWLYNHQTGEEIIVKDAKSAKEYGVTLRHRTEEEKLKFGGDAVVWDWEPGSHWRITPKPKERVFDPRKPEYGKEFVQHAVPTSVSNRQLLEQVLPEITAAVAAALTQGANAVVRPGEIDAERWKKYLAFEAWQKTQEAIDDVVAEPALVGNPEEEIIKSDEWTIWESEAAKHDIKVDKRWSLKTLKEKVQQAA